MSSTCNTEGKVVKGLAWVLWMVLAINLTMFVVELAYGLATRSNALVSDSLDMLSDAFVYATSLLVLSRSHLIKARVSLLKGVVMGLLGLFIVYEVIQKVLNPHIPDASTITILGIISLVANMLCAFLLLKFRDNDLNLKSAWICSRNDAVTSTSVIAAGLLVGYFNTMWPDVLIGLAVATLVLVSSFGIIRESLAHSKKHCD